jgi:hypothetical protein
MMGHAGVAENEDRWAVWKDTAYFVLLIALVLFVSFVLASAAHAANPGEHWVKPYFRQDGTPVSGHWQTNPNETQRDNYSTLGNVNPHTGKLGWIPALH